MKIRPLKNEADYDEALLAIEKLWGAKAGTPKADKLGVLALLVQAYEREHYPMPPPDPIDAIRFQLDQMGLNQTALAKIMMVDRGRASEIVNRKRALTLPMIRRLAEGLQLPEKVLVREYELEG